MHVLEGFHELVHDELLVDVLEDVGTNDRVEVRFHVFKDEVHVLVVGRFDHVQETDDVLVGRHLLQKHDLAEGALGVRGVLERVEDLLQGDGLSALAINRFPDDTVGAFA